MFDHVSLKVRDFGKSLKFYRAALAPLGYEAQQLDEQGKSVGFGPKGEVALWIGEGALPSSAHLAFKSPNRSSVSQFFEAGLKSGGKDNGKPGLRPDYSKDYYAAYLFDRTATMSRRSLTAAKNTRGGTRECSSGQAV